MHIIELINNTFIRSSDTDKVTIPRPFSENLRSKKEESPGDMSRWFYLLVLAAATIGLGEFSFQNIFIR